MFCGTSRDCTCMPKKYMDIFRCIYTYVAGVQNSRSEGLYAVSGIGIEMLIYIKIYTYTYI